MSHHPHKSGGSLAQGNILPQLVTTFKYLAVCPELPRSSITYPLIWDGYYMVGTCSSAASLAQQLPQPGRGTADGSQG